MDNNNFSYKEFKNLASILNNLSAFEISLIGSILGLIISEGLDMNEQNIIGNFLELVGQVILTYNAKVDSLYNINYNNLKFQIDKLNLEINNLKNKIKKE